MRELSHVIDVSIALANAASFSQAAASGHIILVQKTFLDVISTVENYSAQMAELLACQPTWIIFKFVLPVQVKSDFYLPTATIQGLV